MNKLDWTVFSVSGVFLLLIIILSFVNSTMVGNAITTLFDLSADVFGAYWQLLLLGNFFIGIALAFSKYGNVRLGNQEKPKYSYYRWVAMILTTLLASGGVFWAAAEPMYHFMSTPPVFGDGAFNDIPGAFSYAFMHWGFTAWAILGTLATIVMMYVHYSKGLPMRPRALLYPIFGEKIYHKSVLGSAADSVSIIATVAGTLGPLGFLGLQVSYGLNHIFGIPNTVTMAIVIVIILVVIAGISAATGVDRGILHLSRMNDGLTIFNLDSFIGGSGVHLQNCCSRSMCRGDSEWLGGWTIFFWGWFIRYGPMLIIFISRISRGRTIRDLIIAVSIVAPLVSNFWFSIVGGTGVFFEIEKPGSIRSEERRVGKECRSRLSADREEKR